MQKKSGYNLLKSIITTLTILAVSVNTVLGDYSIMYTLAEETELDEILPEEETGYSELETETIAEESSSDEVKIEKIEEQENVQTELPEKTAADSETNSLQIQTGFIELPKVTVSFDHSISEDYSLSFTNASDTNFEHVYYLMVTDANGNEVSEKVTVTFMTDVYSDYLLYHKIGDNYEELSYSSDETFISFQTDSLGLFAFLPKENESETSDMKTEHYETEDLTEENLIESETELKMEIESELLSKSETTSESESEWYTEAEMIDTEAATEWMQPETVQTEFDNFESETEAESESETETESASDDQSGMEGFDNLAKSLSGLGLLTDLILPQLAATAVSRNVICYVSLDGVWTQVGTITEAYTGYNPSGSYTARSRPYITAAQAETVFGMYGFDASSVTEGDRILPHTDAANTSLLWADAQILGNGEEARIPLSNNYNTTYLYYAPNNTSGHNSYFTNYKAKGNETFLTENSFYTVSVNDAAGVCDGNVPDNQYCLYGTSVTMTFPKKDGIKWKVTNPDTGKAITNVTTVDNGDTVTITVSDISSKVQFTSVEDVLKVTYNAGVTDSLTTIGYIYPASQNIIEDGSVKGKLSYTENVTGSTYIILNTDSDVANTSTGSSGTSGYQLYYNFAGWRVGNSDTILTAGTTYTKDEVEALSDDGTLELNAVWSAKDEDDRSVTVNFYVNLACEIQDNESNGFTSHPASNFTSSVFATRIWHEQSIPSSVQQIIAPPNDASSAYDVDATIRSADTTAISDYGVTLSQVPSDEAILAKIREIQRTASASKKITIDGTVVNADDITSENFTIRWYVLKYEYSDGWHIDGILVAKQAHVAVKKTFAGDDDAIMDIKKNWYMSVSHTENSNTVTDFTLNLQPVSDTNKGGYTEYDETTDTYTWVLDGHQGRTYDFAEGNYELPGNYSEESWSGSYQYRILNDDTASGLWTNYDGSCVSAVAVSYASDAPTSTYKTVEFRNTYVESNTFTLHKLDDVLGDSMANVGFKISYADGETMTLYRKPGTRQYSLSPDAPDYGYTEEVADHIIYTGSNGNAYIHLPKTSNEAMYEFYLEEVIPKGYSGSEKICVKVANDGSVEDAFDAETGEDSMVIISGKNLTVKNYSKRYTRVTMQKVWNVEDGKEQPVTVELWRNGAKLTGSQYTQVLSEDNNWTYEWNDLPVYIGGEVATYSLREVKIGDAIYDTTEGTDGFGDYVVIYSPNVYWNSSDGVRHNTPVWEDENGEIQYADEVLLVVNNEEVDARPRVKKVDGAGNALSGAVFTLYSDPSCTVPLESVTTGSDGMAVFSEHSAGAYYLKEVEAPSGYIGSDTVYRAIVKNGECHIYNKTTEITQVVNTQKPTTDVAISKTVTGNMGSKVKEFFFEVLVDSDDITWAESADGYNIDAAEKKISFSLSDGESVTLKNLPIDAEIRIRETNANGYTSKINDIAVEVGSYYSVTVEENLSISVINDRTIDTTVMTAADTNRNLWSIIGIASGIGLLWFCRKKKKRQF